MLPGHRVDGLLGAESRQRAPGRRGRRVRAGADRPVRHGGRAAHGRVAHHRRRQRAEARQVAKRMGADVVLDPDGDGRGRRDQARSPAAASTSPSRRWASRRRSRTRCAACARRDAVEPGRLLGPPHDAARRHRCRARRPADRDHALPRRQGAHAPPDRPRARRRASIPSRSSRTGCRSTASRRRIGCSASGATACSRSRSCPDGRRARFAARRSAYANRARPARAGRGAALAGLLQLVRAEVTDGNQE